MDVARVLEYFRLFFFHACRLVHITNFDLHGKMKADIYQMDMIFVVRLMILLRMFNFFQVV